MLKGENAISIECELHALTRTTTHKAGWFGLTLRVNDSNYE